MAATFRTRRARTDYPDGVLAIYDRGPKALGERFTVVYMPDTYEGEQWFTFAYIDEDGRGSHGEARGWDRPRSSWGRSRGAGAGKVIAFDGLTPEAQAYVMHDLAPRCDTCGITLQDVIGCPDGAEVCPSCFDAGAH